MLALTGSSLVAALGLTVLGLADPAAGLVGRRFGRIKLVHGRSLEGTTAFVLVGALACLGLLTLCHPTLGWSAAVGLTLAAVIPGALAELFAHKIDDNLLVPMAAGAGAIAYCLITGIPL
jgi:dolichol kinase